MYALPTTVSQNSQSTDVSSATADLENAPRFGPRLGRAVGLLLIAVSAHVWLRSWAAATRVRITLPSAGDPG